MARNRQMGPILYWRMPRKPHSTISLTKEELEALDRAMEMAAQVEGVRYTSRADFARDALRRRIQAINEEWRRPKAPRRPP